MFKSAVCGLTAAILTCAPSIARADEPLPLELFAQMPRMEMVTISPDGQHIAYLSDRDGTRVLAIRESLSRRASVVYMPEIRPESLFWANDHVLLVSASQVENYSDVTGLVDFAAVLAFDLDNGLAYQQLLTRSRLVGRNLDLGRVLGVRASDGYVLIPARGAEGNYDLLAANSVRNDTRVEARGSDITRDWIVDENGNAVARTDYSNTRDEQRIMVRDGNRWRAILEETEVDRPVYTAWGLLPDGTLAIAAIIRRDGTATTRGLFSVSMESGEVVATVFRDPRYDIAEVVTDPYTNRVVGVTYDEVYSRHVWFDAGIAAQQASLQASLPDQQVRIENWSRDRKRFIISTQSADQPRAFQLLDVDSGEMTAIGSAYGSIAAGALRPRLDYEYPARDGTPIPGYLVTPEGDGPFPTVVLPHGGPAIRETGGFDYIAHFLASRGYAVLQPNFRGSDGYGAEWELAGYGQWGTGVMQDDLTDGVAALVQAGITDPDRVCIVGASYGGYAALAGASFTPDLYHCAAAIAPVADLPAMLSYTHNRFGRRHWILNYWQDEMQGDSEVRRMALLHAASPADHADQIRIPVLLIHGRDDSVVPIEQSRTMDRALRRAGGNVELVELPGGDHWLTSSDMRTRVLTELERFLGENIGDSAN